MSGSTLLQPHRELLRAFRQTDRQRSKTEGEAEEHHKIKQGEVESGLHQAVLRTTDQLAKVRNANQQARDILGEAGLQHLLAQAGPVSAIVTAGMNPIEELAGALSAATEAPARIQASAEELQRQIKRTAARRKRLAVVGVLTSLGVLIGTFISIWMGIQPCGWLDLWLERSGCLDAFRYGGHYGLGSIAFSPDGLMLAGGSYQDIRLWDAGGGREMRTFSFAGPYYISALAFSPDGRLLASGTSGGTVQLWEVASGREIRTFAGSTERVLSLAIANSGDTVVSVTGDLVVRFLDVLSGSELNRLAMDPWGTYGTSVYGAYFSQDGRTLILPGEPTTLLLDAVSGQVVDTLGRFTGKVALSPDSRTLAYIHLQPPNSTTTLELWDLTNGGRFTTLDWHARGGEQIIDVDFSPDGRILALAITNGTMILWRMP